MSEQDNLRFSEAISDFAALVQECGAEVVEQALASYYPTQHQQLVGSINNRKVAALFRPGIKT